MCGRYAATASPDELVEEFEIDFVDEQLAELCPPRYNIAPTDPVAAVVERLAEGVVTRKLVPLRWGLVPSWAKAPTATMINARVETVTGKPAFRKAAAARRCVLPALGYYEWRSETPPGAAKPVKQPYFLRRSDGGSLLMAGLYEFWKGPAGWVASATIITTEASDELGWVHDRMPMVVPQGSLDDWLDPTMQDAALAVSMLLPPISIGHSRVSRAVGKVGNEGPDLIVPVGE